MKRELLPYQARWVQDKAGLKVIEKSRRIGLSWAEAYDAVMHAGDGHGNVYYQSYNRDMTRGFINDCAGWAEDLQVGAEAVGETLIDVGSKEAVQAFRIELHSGKEIVAMSSSPRGFRSRGRPGDRAILDEAAFVDDLAEVLKAALAFRMWGGTVHILSTHNGEGSAFNTLISEVREGSRLGSLHSVPFNDAVEDGLCRRIFEVSGGTWSPEAEAEWVAEIRKEYGSAAEEELDCIPSAAGGAWLTWEEIRAAEHQDAGDPELFARRRDSVTWIGNDIARRQHLWVAWVIDVVGDVAWTREIVEMRNASFSTQDAELDRLVARYRPIRIAMDQTGMGEKPVEDAKARYGESRVDGVIMSGARRLDAATAFKERFEDRTIRIPANNQVLRTDLHSVHKEAGPTGSPRLVADESNKESHADRFWAGALACLAAADGGGPIEGKAVPHGLVSNRFENPHGDNGFIIDRKLGIIRRPQPWPM